MDGIGLLKTLTLSSMVLEAMPTTSAFATALFVGNANVCPPHVLVDTRLRRIPASSALTKPSKAMSRRRRPASWGRAQDPPRCSLHAAASADAAREEDPWMSDIAGSVAGTGEAPFLSHSMISAAAAATATAAAAAAAAAAGGAGGGADGVDSRGDREAFTFAPKPLPEGTTLRPMQETDIDSVVGLAFEEFYEGPVNVEDVSGVEVWGATWRRAKLNGAFQDEDVEELTDWFEMIWLRAVIRWGFGLRARIGKGGQDHKVFCVSDEKGKKGKERPNSGGDLVAVAEVSLQVPNGKTAPPFPVPLVVKRLIAWPGPVMPYISNVLVNPSVRRQGLAKKLMLRCEQQARDWGHTQVYLHVDISYWPAVQLYESMGYEVVSMLEVKWEAPALRYMKKTL